MSATRAFTTVIFDLSEVIVSGLCGVESRLKPFLHLPESSILSAFWTDSLRLLCCGTISEDEYLSSVRGEQGWDISLDELKKHIRANFHWKIAGMRELIHELSQSYHLCLFSDHAREWAEYILAVHPFLGIFPQKLFSFETGLTKDRQDAFEEALRRFERTAEECVFIDDNPGNVEAARSVGMCAIPFTSTRVLRMALEWQGIRVSPADES
ncbi:MAG: HAD-IA family hydrolase [Chitinivibrionales bacterium]|nr:HAD-IA family hydrolase [Chitinivibrionales bacterium]